MSTILHLHKAMRQDERARRFEGQNVRESKRSVPLWRIGCYAAALLVIAVVVLPLGVLAGKAIVGALGS